MSTVTRIVAALMLYPVKFVEQVSADVSTLKEAQKLQLNEPLTPEEREMIAAKRAKSNKS